MRYYLETRYSSVFGKYAIDGRLYDEHCDNVIRTELFFTLEQAQQVIRELTALIAEHGPKPEVPEVQIAEDMVEFY